MPHPAWIVELGRRARRGDLYACRLLDSYREVAVRVKIREEVETDGPWEVFIPQKGGRMGFEKMRPLVEAAQLQEVAEATLARIELAILERKILEESTALDTLRRVAGIVEDAESALGQTGVDHTGSAGA
jgi:hypothetical protein